MCVCVCVSVCLSDQETLDVFGWLTKVMIYSCSTILLQSVVVLASLIPGLIVAGWQDIWLTHKQLNNTNWGCLS